MEAFRENFGQNLLFFKGDLTDYNFIENIFRHFEPEAIIHLGENPSAPYSMIDVKHATWTQTNNIVGTLNILYAMRDICPGSHLVKLGTMGEYGTPNIDIPEGFFEIEYRGRKDSLPFPRQAGSWYHQSKVHDSNNVMMACRIWGLRSTDVMQGVVFGTRIDEMGDDERLLTRLDFDQCFGTAINRFCCQAVIGEPLTPYGKGHQKRGFLPLRDSMQCLTIAVENPPPMNEGLVPKPLSPYGASKLSCEGYCSAFYGSYGLKTAVLRFSNAYGPYSLHKNSVIARFIKDGLIKEELTVYGDGMQTRDFIHVGDLCNAIHSFLNPSILNPATWGETFHLGTGKETRIIDLAEMVKRLFGDEVRIVFEPPRTGEIKRNFSDTRKARELLGFTPKKGLEDGVREVYDWFLKQGTERIKTVVTLSGSE